MLKAWIAQLNAAFRAGTGGGAALPRTRGCRARGAAVQDAELRRLTHSQYNHTVRDLLGDQTAPANQFPPEDFINGFRNQSHGQSLSPLLMEGYSAAAEKLARVGVSGRRYARADSVQTFGRVPARVSCGSLG